MPRLAMRLWRAAASAIGAAAAAGVACSHPVRYGGMSSAAACPRDSVRDKTGRCACIDGDVPMLGACVPPAVADAFCGPAAMAIQPSNGPSVGGCVFRSCEAGAVLDVASGRCSRPTPASASSRLTDPQATCPRGTRRVDDAAECQRPAGCSPGTLPESSSCRPIVFAAESGSNRPSTRVDVGAWAAIAFGVDGGPGSPEVCQPLAQHPNAFGVPSTNAPPGVRIAVALMFPDQDVSRVHAEVHAVDEAGHPLSPAGDTAVSDAVKTLVELLRGLGGEASAAVVQLEVRCAI